MAWNFRVPHPFGYDRSRPSTARGWGDQTAQALAHAACPRDGHGVDPDRWRPGTDSAPCQRCHHAVHLGPWRLPSDADRRADAKAMTTRGW